MRLSRSDGGVYCHSYDEGFPHGFILVSAHYTHIHFFPSLSHYPAPSPLFFFLCLFPEQALRTDHPQTPLLPEEVQNQVTLHLERALVR